MRRLRAVADRFRRLLDRLGLSQAQLAGVLGLSAPVLSQLEAMVGKPGWHALARTEQERQIEAVRAAKQTTLTVDHPKDSVPEPPATADPVAIIQALLRDLASAAELGDAARLLAPHHPDLAEALRALGAGRTQDARA